MVKSTLRFGPIFVVAGVVGLLFAVLRPAPAFGISSNLSVRIAGDGAGWTSTPKKPMLDPGAIVPGQTVTGTADLRNQSSVPAVLSLHLSGVKGTLAPELEYSVSLAQDAGPVWRGTLATLVKGIVVDPRMAAGRTDTCQVAVTFPAGAGNEWQGASASFEEVFTLVQGSSLVSGSEHGAGVSASSVVVPSAAQGPPSSRPTGALAFTGQRVYSMLAAGLGAVSLGVLLTVAPRRRVRAEVRDT